MLRRVDVNDVPDARRDAVDAETLAAAGAIVARVRDGGEGALRALAEQWDGLAPGAPLVLGAAALRAAADALAPSTLELLRRCADRIESFARVQRAALPDVAVPVPGGEAGHTWAPVGRAGCYAPGGRFPLPSTVLMTVIPARVAGVGSVVVASPRPEPITLAAAWVAGADAVLVCGGAQAVAAMAFGVGFEPVDVIVGPGNRWVTAAKQLVVGRVGIDMLAGPSELLVIADGGADPSRIAADLLAQAEHDPDAIPILVSPCAVLLDAVDVELLHQLETLPTAATAAAALQDQGLAVHVRDLDEAVTVSDRIAPEHLQLMVEQPDRLSPSHYGALFVGADAAEVLGDYAAGPNHVLPTGSGARFHGGLSVADFLCLRTWLRIDDPVQAQGLVQDATDLARLEGLEGHARAAEARLTGQAVGRADSS